MKREEILKKIEIVKNAIDNLQSQVDDFYNKEQAIKLILNSIYGAIGNPHMVFFNPYIAEAVTAQGKEIILYSEKIMNHYFQNVWHTDTKLHEKLGLRVYAKIENTVVVYIDTDSNYVSFDELFKTCNYKETKYKDNEIQLILDIYKYRLEKYLNDLLDKFAKDRNTHNYQTFELEKIGYSGIWVGKKKYTIDTAWAAPNAYYKPLSKISYTGIEIIQSSTPEFIRGELQDIVKYLLSSDNVDIKELVNLLKELKKRYIKEPDFDKKCKSIKVNDYEKYCVDDKNKLDFAHKCPINVRAAITYNYFLNNSEYKEKYENIGSGEKIKFYYCKGTTDVFAYLPNSYPREIAPEIDYDVMFDKTVLSPINTFLEAMGKQTINASLEYKRAIF